MNTTSKSPIINNSDDKLVLYTDRQGDVELRADVERDTLWATQEQIGRIFDASKQSISRHMLRIFKEGELKEDSVVKEYLTTAKDGRQYLTKFYNLDAIIAVGYRVNSKRATRFRIWATRVLREYLVNGFAIRQKKLAGPQQNFDNLQEALSFMESGSRGGPLKARMSLRLYKDVMK
jgi:hypothetical protein